MEVTSHNGDWGDSFHKGFSDNEKRTDALWLQKNGIAAVLLLGEVAETVLLSTDQVIYMYVQESSPELSRIILTKAPFRIHASIRILQRDKGMHSPLYTAFGMIT